MSLFVTDPHAERGWVARDAGGFGLSDGFILEYDCGMTTRFTISLPDEDARVLDAYVRDHSLGGRSAGIRAAVRMLGAVGLERDYAAAFVEGGVDDDWDVTSADDE
jgi:hypothetical protein